MANRGVDIKDSKMRGEWAELRFMARAAEHGLRVTKPWGDSAKYDFAVERQGRFLRVQVKSVTYMVENSYLCNFRTGRGGSQVYTAKQVDFMAAYVVPRDIWYIIPIRVAAALRGGYLLLSPHREDTKYNAYKEAWNLLCGKKRVGSAASPSIPAGNEASASPPMADQPEDAEGSPEAWPVEDRPMSIVEARFEAIRQRLLAHPCFKPRR